MSGLSDAALRHLREISDQPDLTGTPYALVETLGRGGMGAVYLAHDSRLDREVALKVVQLPEGKGDLDRLLLEARVLAQLEHPGIVPVHDAGVLPDGRAFYVMKHVRGYGLDEYARTAPLPERLRAFERICEAVAFAHAHGVIHRDLKPENVMVGPFGEVLVMDWGVAKVRRPRLSPSGTPPPNPPHRERGSRLEQPRRSPSSPGVGGGRGREKRVGVMRVLGGRALRRRPVSRKLSADAPPPTAPSSELPATWPPSRPGAKWRSSTSARTSGLLAPSSRFY